MGQISITNTPWSCKTSILSPLKNSDALTAYQAILTLPQQHNTWFLFTIPCPVCVRSRQHPWCSYSNNRHSFVLKLYALRGARW